MNYCIDIPHWASIAGRWLFDWQTLVAGALALIGGFLTVKHVRKQIRQSDEHRLDEIARRLLAARLLLPLALAKTSDLLQTTVDEVASELEQFGPDGFNKALDANFQGRGNRAHFPSERLPDDVIEAFRQLIQSLTDPSNIRHVAELVASLQIYLSRYNSFDLQMIGVRASLENLMLDAAKIRLLIDGMFNYARFVDDASFGLVGTVSTNEAWDKIHGKAQSLVFLRDIPDSFFPAFKEQIDRSKDNGVSPWNEKFEG